MNRFRKMGFIEYNGRIRVHKSLLNVVLHDQFDDQNSVRPAIAVPAEAKNSQAKARVSKS
jgi:hypothetical protein